MIPRKTAKEISDLVILQLETSLNTTIPLLPRAFNRVLAKALGGIFVLLYQFAGFNLLQIFPKTASNEPITVGGITVIPLAMWGELVGLFQNLGQKSEYTIRITVITQTGTLTSGTKFVNTATGMIYVLIGDVALDAAIKYATVRATQSGILGNVDVGQTFSFSSPPTTVSKTVTVTAILQVGTDQETTDAYRERVVEYWAARPQGGAYADYRTWAEEVDGVRNAYPYSGWEIVPGYATRAGEVFIFIESSADVDGVPTYLGVGGRPPSPEVGGLLQNVYDHIEADETGLASRRNINAYVRVYPIHAEPWSWLVGGRTEFDISVSGLASVDDQSDTETAIETALTDYFLDREPYIPGLSIPPRKDIITVTGVGAVCGQIAAAHGGAINSVTVSVSSVPIADNRYYLSEGEKCKIGTVTFL